MQCLVYKSLKQIDYYLYVNKDEELRRVPDALKRLLGRLQKVRSDVERLIATTINVLFTTLVGVVFVMIYAINVHWVIAPVFLLTVPLLGWLSSVLGKRIKAIVQPWDMTATILDLFGMAKPPELIGDPEREARFQREAKVLASLHHPNIASVFGFENTGECTFLVMELVEGDDLSERISRGAPHWPIAPLTTSSTASAVCCRNSPWPTM